MYACPLVYLVFRTSERSMEQSMEEACLATRLCTWENSVLA
jgi:hypothetical protein